MAVHSPSRSSKGILGPGRGKLRLDIGDECRRTCMNVLLIVVCVLGVVQYGIVMTFGYVVDDICNYYGLTLKQGTTLFSCMTFGACTFSFIPGICYDKLGGSISMLIGIIISCLPALFQMLLTPTEAPFLSTMNTLAVSCTIFGFAGCFFNVIGTIAPLAVFPEEHVGRVNAFIQVWLSLGMTLQSGAYAIIKSYDGDYIENYLCYVFVFTWTSGTLMAIVLWASKSVLLSSVCSEVMNESYEDSALEPDLRQCLLPELVFASSERSGHEKFLTDIQELYRNRTFIFMTAVFMIPMAYQFSFLNFVSHIASDAGASTATVGVVFGIVNAFGRLFVSMASDYTYKHPLGGHVTYIVLSLLTFGLALLVIAATEEAGPSTIHFANALAAFGYGGLMGIIPPALRVEFGAEKLGFIYGILWSLVGLLEPLWSSFVDVDMCKGVDCFRAFLYVGFGAMVLTALFGCLIIKKNLDARSVLM